MRVWKGARTLVTLKWIAFALNNFHSKNITLYFGDYNYIFNINLGYEATKHYQYNTYKTLIQTLLISK